MAKPHPPDRREVRPDHLLRAVLDDRLVGQVLAGLGTSPDEVRATLEHRWLAGVEDLDAEDVYAFGIDIETVLTVINPPFDGEPDWRGRTLNARSREVLARALVESRTSGALRVDAGHLLLGLASSRDPVVAGTLREHGVRIRPTRDLVRQWGRRAG